MMVMVMVMRASSAFVWERLLRCMYVCMYVCMCAYRGPMLPARHLWTPPSLDGLSVPLLGRFAAAASTATATAALCFPLHPRLTMENLLNTLNKYSIVARIVQIVFSILAFSLAAAVEDLPNIPAFVSAEKRKEREKRKEKR